MPDSQPLGLDIGGTSIKLVVLGPHGVPLVHSQSHRYAQPSLSELSETVADLIAKAQTAIHAATPIGLCLPGQFEPDGLTVRYSANLPALCGVHVPTLLGLARGATPDRLTIVPDAQAAAIGSWNRAPISGRLLAISLGTGVGASLLLNGRPALLAPGSSGHFGQIDVSLSDDAPIGPDGGRGSLESYVGLPALQARFGEPLTDAIESLPQDDPVLAALARALRVAHAIYTPDEVRLLGGVGIALKPKLATLRSLVDRDLTAVARSGWTLVAENSLYLAAMGAALEAVAARER